MSVVPVDPVARTLGPRSPVIDALRALACSMVIVMHAANFVGHGGNLRPGDTALATVVGEGGVTLFFVISGYLVAGPFIRALAGGRPLPDPGMYALRRAARILPAWWLALAFAASTTRLTGLGTPTGGAIVANASLLFFFIPRYAQGSPIGQGWTLCIEAAFYVAVPLAAAAWVRLAGPRITRESLARALTLGWCAAVLCGVVQDLWVDVGGSSSIGGVRTLMFDLLSVRWIALFIPGILVALALDSQGGPSRTVGWVATLARRRASTSVLAAALAVLAWAVQLGGREVFTFLLFPLLGLAMGCVFLLAVTGETAWWSRLGWPARLGLLTYGFYLFHVTVALLVARWLGLGFAFGTVPLLSYAAQLLLTVIVVTVAALPFAMLSWFVVERPAIRWAATRSVTRWRSERRRLAPADR